MNRLLDIAAAMLAKASKFLGSTHLNALREDQIQFRYNNNMGFGSNMYINHLNRNLIKPGPTDLIQYINGNTNICNNNSFENLEKALHGLIEAFNLHKQNLNQIRCVQNLIGNVPVKSDDIIFSANLQQQRQLKVSESAKLEIGNYNPYYSMTSGTKVPVPEEYTNTTPEYIDKKDPDAPKEKVLDAKSPYFKGRLLFEHMKNIEKERNHFKSVLSEVGVQKHLPLHLQGDMFKDILATRLENKEAFVKFAKENFPEKFITQDLDKHITILNHERLGSGVNGPVVKAQIIDKNIFIAWKKIRVSFHRNDFLPKVVARELLVMNREIVHPNIVQLEAVFLEENTDLLCMGMEYMDYNLSDFVFLSNGHRLQEKETTYVFKQILSGLLHLYRKLRVFHGDLKPENILINKAGQVKLADFGYAKKTRKNSKTPSGTSVWMAPEVADYQKESNYKSDVWSLGIILLEMIDGLFCARESFRDKSNEGIMKNIAEATEPLTSENLKPTDPLAILLSSLLTIDPNERVSIFGAKNILNTFVNTGKLEMAKQDEFANHFIRVMKIK